MATGFALPPPSSLEIHAPNAAEKWKKFLLAWKNYTLAMKLDKEEEPVQVATLLTVIGEEARDVYSTFEWTDEADAVKIEPVLHKLGEYCEPRRNIPFERFRFNRRVQEPGETYEHYRTELKKIAESCNFEEITPEEILRDRLLFGIRDDKVRERLLRESQLTLKKTDEICRASESMQKQMKVVGNNSDVSVSAVYSSNKGGKAPQRKKEFNKQRPMKECANCGKQHDMTKKENCPAYLKACRKCGKLSHFARKCRSSKRVNGNNNVKAVEIDNNKSEDECFEVTTAGIDDSQLITLTVVKRDIYRRYRGLLIPQIRWTKGVICNCTPTPAETETVQRWSSRKIRSSLN